MFSQKFGKYGSKIQHGILGGIILVQVFFFFPGGGGGGGCFKFEGFFGCWFMTPFADLPVTFNPEYPLGIPAPLYSEHGTAVLGKI